MSNKNEITNNEINSTSAPPGNNLNELPSKTFKLSDFEIRVFQAENSIIFHSTEIKDYSNTLYKAELSLDELIKLNRRIFNSFTSIEEVFTEFFKTLGENYVLVKKEENKINLTIIGEFLGRKQEAKIILNPQKPPLEETVPKLCDKVKEIDSLNLIIDEQKKIIEKMNKEFNDYKNYAENKFKEFEALINRESENLQYNIEYNNCKYLNSDEITKYKAKLAKFKDRIDSNIMKYNGLKLIENGVKNKLGKKIKKYNLLFRASENNYRAANFHTKCDGRNNTLTIVETKNGRIFGGFTDASWNQNNSNYSSGSNGFIFSLDNYDIYYNSNSSYNIYSHSSYGPYFGSGDFIISDNCYTNTSSESMGNSYYNNGKKYPLTGYYQFAVKDYEVFQLELE
jgi:hypothetical protein